VLAVALVAGIAKAGLGSGWAALLVGGGFAIVAFILINRGVADLKASNLTPTRTSESLSKDADMVKGAVS